MSQKKRFLARQPEGRVHRIEVYKGGTVNDLLEEFRKEVELNKDDDIVCTREGEQFDKSILLSDLPPEGIFTMTKMDNVENNTLGTKKFIVTMKGFKAETVELRLSDGEAYDLIEECREIFGFSKEADIRCSTSEESAFFDLATPLSDLPRNIFISDETKTIKSQLSQPEVQVLHNETEEPSMIERKMNNLAVEGIIYEVLPETLEADSCTEYKEFTFKSEAESSKADKKIATEDEWKAWKAGGGISLWGVFSSQLSVGQSKKTNTYVGRISSSSQRNQVAIRVKWGFQHIKKFKAKVMLNDKCKTDAKMLRKLDGEARREKMEAFYAKYPKYVYTGTFIAGGEFKSVATARSSEKLLFSYLEERAIKETSSMWRTGCLLNIEGVPVDVGIGSRSGSLRRAETGYETEKGDKKVTIDYHVKSTPSHVENMQGLEEKLMDAHNWTIFPEAIPDSSKFETIYEMMRKEGEDLQDEELIKAARILEGARWTGSIVGNNRRKLLLVGKTGAGKSSLCNALSGTQEEEFKTSAFSTGCTQKTKLANILFNNEEDKPISIIDTIGFGDIHKDEDQDIIAELVETLRSGCDYVNLFGLVINGQDPRLDKSLLTMFRMFEQMFDPQGMNNFWSQVVVIFTRIGMSKKDVQKRERNNKASDLEIANHFLETIRKEIPNATGLKSMSLDAQHDTEDIDEKEHFQTEMKNLFTMLGKSKALKTDEVNRAEMVQNTKKLEEKVEALEKERLDAILDSKLKDIIRDDVVDKYIKQKQTEEYSWFFHKLKEKKMDVDTTICLEIFNFSDESLIAHNFEPNTGYKVPDDENFVNVDQGTVKGICFRKRRLTHSGISGTISWKIGQNGDKVLVLMYDFPYDEKFVPTVGILVEDTPGLSDKKENYWSYFNPFVENLPKNSHMDSASSLRSYSTLKLDLLTNGGDYHVKVRVERKKSRFLHIMAVKRYYIAVSFYPTEFARLANIVKDDVKKTSTDKMRKHMTSNNISHLIKSIKRRPAAADLAN